VKNFIQEKIAKITQDAKITVAIMDFVRTEYVNVTQGGQVKIALYNYVQIIVMTEVYVEIGSVNVKKDGKDLTAV
jgi:hypothetical protein